VDPPRVRWSFSMSRIIVLAFSYILEHAEFHALHFVVIFLSFGLHMICINS
jgi:hypothetical protein